jgi:hypothetical protein
MRLAVMVLAFAVALPASAARYKCIGPDGKPQDFWTEGECPIYTKKGTPLYPSDIRKIIGPKCELGDSELDAYEKCETAVEALAKYQAEWQDGWLDMKFPVAKCHDASTGAVLLIGDKVKFQNGFGAWQWMRYSCIWDPAARRVLDAAAIPR